MDIHNHRRDARRRPPRVATWTCAPDRYAEIADHVAGDARAVLAVENVVNAVAHGLLQPAVRRAGAALRESLAATGADAGRRSRLEAFLASSRFSFPGVVAFGERALARAGVEALYEHFMLPGNAVAYRWERAFCEASGEQALRAHHEVLDRDPAQRGGTCIDLVLMFLAVLAAAGFAPVYVQARVCDPWWRGRGVLPEAHHALAAVWLDDAENERLRLAHDDPTCAGLIPEPLFHRWRADPGGTWHDGPPRLLVFDCTGFAHDHPNRGGAIALAESWAEVQRHFDAGAYRLEFALDVAVAQRSRPSPWTACAQGPRRAPAIALARGSRTCPARRARRVRRASA